jgi:hypothetical protein
MVSQSVSLGVKPHLGLMTRYLLLFDSCSLSFLWGAPSDERMGLSFVHAAGPCQRSLSQVRILWDSRTYFTVSDLRLPFSSPPTTRMTPVASFVFKITPQHGSRRKHSLYCCRGVFTSSLHSNSRGADHIENAVLLLLRA